MEIPTTLETPVEYEVSPKDKKNNIKTGLRNIAMITRKRAYMQSGENKAIQYNIVLLISLQLKSSVDTAFSQGKGRRAYWNLLKMTTYFQHLIWLHTMLLFTRKTNWAFVVLFCEKES